MVPVSRAGLIVVALLAVLVTPRAGIAQDDGTFAPTHRSSAEVPVVVRSEPSLQSAKVGFVGPLTPLMILEERDDAEGTAWSRILAPDGTSGWIRTMDTAPLPETAITLPASTPPAPVASPAAACATAPRTEPPSATAAPPPSVLPAAQVAATGQLVVASAALPPGPPASPAQVAGIVATLRELVACQVRIETTTTEQIDAIARQLGLFTDDYLRRHADPWVLAAGTPVPGGPPWFWGALFDGSLWAPGTEPPEVLEPRQLPDGRVGAIVAQPNTERRFVVFAPVGDRWLIDEVAIIA
jgi:hypothetical protein